MAGKGKKGNSKRAKIKIPHVIGKDGKTNKLAICSRQAWARRNAQKQAAAAKAKGGK